MTTQKEVIQAFLNFEDEPSQASNFKMVIPDEEPSTAYLVGGDGAVYAKREPIKQVTYYEEWCDFFGWSSPASIMPRTLRRQCRFLRTIIGGRYSSSDTWNERHDDNVDFTINEGADPTTDDFPHLQ